MKVYILTSEPYHENSSVVGVYLEEEAALYALKSIPNELNINEPDYQLVEWDTDENKELRSWYMEGRQVREKGPLPWDKSRIGMHAVRIEYTLSGPEKE